MRSKKRTCKRRNDGKMKRKIRKTRWWVREKKEARGERGEEEREEKK